jgi:hypothetical protein
MPRETRRLHGRANHRAFFRAEQSFFSGVRIETGDRKTGANGAVTRLPRRKEARQFTGGQIDRLGHDVARQRHGNSRKRHVNGREHDLQGSDQNIIATRGLRVR